MRETGEDEKAVKASCLANTCNILGILTAVSIVVTIIVLRVIATSTSERETPSNY